MTIAKCSLIALFALLTLPMAANADLIYIDVVPTGGAAYPFTMTGSFDFDSATSTYSNLTVYLTADIGPFSFNNTACEGCPMSGSSTGLYDPSLAPDNFLSDFVVTWAGGAITAIFRGNGFGLDEPNGRLDGTYSLLADSAPVPEPGVLALLGIGLLAMAATQRRKKA